MQRKKKEEVKCKVCKKKLDDFELDFYKSTKKPICMDCENQQLDEQGEELDRLYEELSKDV